MVNCAQWNFDRSFGTLYVLGTFDQFSYFCKWTLFLTDIVRNFKPGNACLIFDRKCMNSMSNIKPLLIAQCTKLQLSLVSKELTFDFFKFSDIFKNLREYENWCPDLLQFFISQKIIPIPYLRMSPIWQSSKVFKKSTKNKIANDLKL